MHKTILFHAKKQLEMKQVLILLFFPVLLSGQVIPDDQGLDYVVLKSGERLENKIVKVAASQIWIEADDGSTRKINNKDIKDWKDYDLSLIEFKRNDDDRIEYSEVVQLEGATKDQLYNAARLWYANYFRDSKEVLELDDREGGILVGTGWGDIYANIGITTVKNKFWRTVKIQVKEGRYKYTIGSLDLETYADQYSDSVKFSLEDSPISTYPEKMKGKAQMRKVQKQFKEEIIADLQGMCNSIKSALNQSSKADDDW